MPYGFPSGVGLRDLICGPGKERGQIRAVLTRRFGDEVIVDRFIEALQGSGRMSVDSFLEHREDLRPIGRAAIAAALIPFEDPVALASPDLQRGAWYSHLFEQLDAPLSKWRENTLTVITYNYDRSLEYFLQNALVHSYNLSLEQASELASVVRVLHLHGSLCRLGPDGGDSRAYVPQVTSGRIGAAQEAVRIICEAQPDDPSFKEARRAISDAERVFFLGFGYNQTNLERLGRSSFTPGQRRYGTCMGLARGERDEVVNWFESFGGIQLGDPSHDILRMLRELPALRSHR